MSIKVEIIKQLKDNFSYIIYSTENNKALVVDPAQSESILDYLHINNLSLESILITHHHSDHTAGISGIKKIFDINVYSPNKNILETTDLIIDNQKIKFSFIDFKIIATPGHTKDHIVYFNEKESLLFCGDLLFCYGCGRVFEGTMQQMLNSLNKIKDLPNKTKIYCGHEYTYKNLEFILEELIDSHEEKNEKKICKEKIENNGSSMPFYLDHQKKWNPFLQCDDEDYKLKIAKFHKNIGKISSKSSELEIFTFIRNKRNEY